MKIQWIFLKRHFFLPLFEDDEMEAKEKLYSSVFFVFTNGDLLHYIASFFKLIPCMMHNSHNGRRFCVSVKWGELKNGDSVAQAGWLPILIQLQNQLVFSRKAMEFGASNGHLDVIKWLHSNRTEGCTRKAMDSAAEHGYLEVVIWLHSNRTEGCTVGAMGSAAGNGHLDVVKWLHFNRTEGCTAEAMDSAASEGHLEVVKWLHFNRTKGCTKRAIDWAAMGGHLEVIKWLYINRSEGFTSFAMDSAAGRGHLDVLKWFHNHTEDFTYAMGRAAKQGQLELVRRIVQEVVLQMQWIGLLDEDI